MPSSDLEARLANVEESLAHHDVALEDLSAVLNAYRQDLERLKAQIAALERRFDLLLEAMGDGVTEPRV